MAEIDFDQVIFRNNFLMKVLNTDLKLSDERGYFTKTIDLSQIEI